MNQFLDAFTVWSTTRAAGITSYLFLFLSTAAGIMMSMKLLSGRAKAMLLTIHQSSAWFGFLLGAIHGSVLLFDKYVGYTPLELLVPFSAHSHPFLNGIGTIAFYISLILILSSDFIKKLGRRVWRTIHFMAFPGFLMGLLHGFLIGTDSHDTWAYVMYISTAGIVILLTCARVAAVKLENKQRYAA